MPRFLITAPDGTRYQIDGPEGATEQEAIAVAQGQYQSKAAPKADTMRAPDPSEGGGTLSIGPFDTGIRTPQAIDRQLAGVGQAITGLSRGVGQAVGLSNRADVAEARKRDAPLDATYDAKLGNILGNVAMLAPAAFIPGANTAIGSGAIGAATGYLQPSASAGETAMNTGLGGIAGPAAIGAGRALGAVYQGGKALVEPFMKGGQDRIAARTLQNFAGSPMAAAEAARAMQAGGKPLVAGVEPTAGMVSGNAGLAQLERTLANNPELTQAFYGRGQKNSNALLDALRGIAGDPGKREFFALDREAAANKLYQEAFDAYDPKNALTPSLKGEVTKLLKRPSIDDASKIAQRWAIERGEKPTAEGSLRALHDVKTALDDKISQAVQAGQRGEAKALQDTQNKLMNLMNSLSPEYATARQTYASMSEPINRMDVGQALYDKLAPAMTDFGATSRLTPNAFAAAMRNADATAQKATGFSGAKMESVMSPQDMETIKKVGDTLGQISNSQSMGKAIGSNAAQNLVSQNMLRQIAGPLGLPQSFAENALMQGLARPVQWIAKSAEPKVTNRLAQAVLSPEDAAKLLQSLEGNPNAEQLTNILKTYLRIGGAGARASSSGLSNSP